MIAYRAETALVGLLRPHLAIEDRLLHHQRRGGDAALTLRAFPGSETPTTELLSYMNTQHPTPNILCDDLLRDLDAACGQPPRGLTGGGAREGRYFQGAGTGASGFAGVPVSLKSVLQQDRPDR
jgi:hypothetical protein